MNKSITIINGDGVGAEVTQQSIKVLDAVAAHFDHDFSYTYCLMGTAAVKETGNALPDKTIESCLNTNAILFGTINNLNYNTGNEKDKGDDGLLKLKKILGLFANVRRVSTYPTLHHLSPLKNKIIDGTDLVIFRDLKGGFNTESGKPDTTPNLVTDKYCYAEEEIISIAKMAFKSAKQRRKSLTLADNANMPESSRLWRKVVKAISLQYPEVNVSVLLAENVVKQLMLNPKQFDVLLADNLTGDILNEEAGAIIGSAGLLPSANFGKSNALFSPAHGSGQLIADKDIANPFGSILSAAMMLDYFNLKEEAYLVRQAVEWTIGSLFVSKDLDPINFYFTSTIGELVSEYIGGRVSGRVNKENIELRKSTII